MTAPPERADRLWCAAEIAAVAMLLAAQIWLVWDWLPIGETAQRVVRITLLVLLIAVIVVAFVRVPPSRDDLGLAPTYWKQGWGAMAIFTILALLALGITVFVAPAVTLADVNPSWLLTYAHGLIGQQLALQYFLNNRTHRALAGVSEPKRTTLTVIVCVVIFTLLHAPNPGLMISVVPAGAFWCWHFRRFRNMPALLTSHLLLGGAAMMLLGDTLLLRLRIGPPALRLLLGE